MVKSVSRPEFLKQVPKVKNELQAQKRRIIRGANTSIYYANLYQALFGGEVCKLHKGDTEKILYLEARNFHPDIIKTERKEKVFTEIKSMKKRDSRPQCAFKQLENYSHHVLKNLDQYKRPAEFDYAFFSYRNGEKNLDSMTNEELEQHLSKKTVDLLILPNNILFMLLATGNRRALNQTSNKGPDIALYFRPYATTLTGLHKGLESIQKLAEHPKIEEFADLLKLNQLTCSKYYSPKGLYSHEHKVETFRITQYQNQNPKEWAESFKKNHQQLLVEMLRIRDLYEESKEVPF